MTVFRRFKRPLVIAVAVLTALVLLMMALTFLGQGTSYNIGGLSSSIVRGGRAEDGGDQRRYWEHLDADSGIIPSAFFVAPTVTQVTVEREGGDTPQKDTNKIEEGVSSSNAADLRPNLEAVLSEPERNPVPNERNVPLVNTNPSNGLSNNAQPSDPQLADTSMSTITTKLPSFPATTISPPQTVAPVLPSFHPSKELFIRVVHFDDRPRDGHHNISVFLVVALKFITDNNLIVGCQVDHHVAEDFEVKLIGETPLWRAFYNHINHEELMVYCYDLPASSDSRGYIRYNSTVNATTTKIAASERPVKFPAPRIPPTSAEGKKYNLTVVACAKIFNSPPWLGEWITYQKTIGVDHIHLDAEDTFQKYGYIKDPTLQKAIKSGYVSVEIWKEYLNGNELWYHNQGLIYEDCGYRFRNTYDYIVTVDTDDFFTPRVPGEGKLHYYIDKYCRAKTTGSCKFKWIEFFPDHYGFNNLTISNGNVTRRLSNFSHYVQGNPKSLHRTNVLIDTATHYAFKMVSGYKIQQVSPNVAYFAHIRKKKKPPAPGKGLRIGIPHSGACLEHVLSRTLLVLVLVICYICCS